MAYKSWQEAEEANEDAVLSLVDREPVSGHLGPPVDTPADLVAPACPKDTKHSSTPAVSSINLQLAPECLDPHTLGLLWRQRELEIQALRRAIQNRRDPRHGHILQEVAGLPLERSSCSQEKLLQTQVQKLTVELKEQKKQAQLEKAHLEEQLLQTRTALQRLEAQLQALHQSCLLQLARSSWVGRMLRSSTGSVEVVTAEALMDPDDLSENDEAPPVGEGFRLEDVDWNSIAHRYPNLFTNIKSNLDHNHPGAQLPPELPPALSPDESGSELCRRHMEQHLKSVEWSSLPVVGTSSSGSTNSGFSSPHLGMRFPVQKVTGHPPQAPAHTSEQIESEAWSFSRGSQAEPAGLLSLDLQETHCDEPGKTVLAPESGADPDHWHPEHRRPTSSCLKIVDVSPREGFVRIFNESLEDTADLGGCKLQQFLRHLPVRVYRFPPDTLLAPRHHLTVWGEGPDSTKNQLPSSRGREPVHFHSSRGCVTLLLSPKGEVLSEHQAPPCVTPVTRIFDNTDLSINQFPLSEAVPGANTSEQRLRTWALLPRLSTSNLFRSPEVLARPESAETDSRELLPSVPKDGLGLADCQARKEHRIQVCRKSVDRGCPMVALSVQSTAESRFGFRFLSCPPITANAYGRVWGRCRVGRQYRRLRSPVISGDRGGAGRESWEAGSASCIIY